jgi:hypothetical protein
VIIPLLWRIILRSRKTACLFGEVAVIRSFVAVDRSEMIWVEIVLDGVSIRMSSMYLRRYGG